MKSDASSFAGSLNWSGTDCEAVCSASVFDDALNHFFELGPIDAIHEHPPVYVDSWRPGDVGLNRFLTLVLNLSVEYGIVHILLEAIHIHPELSGKLNELLIAETALIHKDHVVHGPELPLATSCQC